MPHFFFSFSMRGPSGAGLTTSYVTTKENPHKTTADRKNEGNNARPQPERAERKELEGPGLSAANKTCPDTKNNENARCSNRFNYKQ